MYVSEGILFALWQIGEKGKQQNCSDFNSKKIMETRWDRKNIEKVSRVLVGYNNRRNARENEIQMECDIRLERLEDGERKI